MLPATGPLKLNAANLHLFYQHNSQMTAAAPSNAPATCAHYVIEQYKGNTGW